MDHSGDVVGDVIVRGGKSVELGERCEDVEGSLDVASV